VDAVWSSPVRYAECDQQGIVFNSHYLTYADEGCTAWFAARGTPYPELIARGLDMHVKTSTLTWAAPARWGDTVEVGCALAALGRTSWTVELDVRAGGRSCCTVTTTYVLVGTDDGRPTPVPDDLRAAWSS
jgi:acyl-CoA thioester hydrolase